MLTAPTIVTVAFLYLCLLFAIAYYGDKRADRGQSAERRGGGQQQPLATARPAQRGAEQVPVGGWLLAAGGGAALAAPERVALDIEHGVGHLAMAAPTSSGFASAYFTDSRSIRLNSLNASGLALSLSVSTRVLASSSLTGAMTKASMEFSWAQRASSKPKTLAS